MTNGHSYCYHLDEPVFIFRGIRSNVSFLFHFSMKIMSAKSIAQDGTWRLAASHLGLFCLPMSHKKDTRLIWIKWSIYLIFFLLVAIFDLVYNVESILNSP